MPDENLAGAAEAAPEVEMPAEPSDPMAAAYGREIAPEAAAPEAEAEAAGDDATAVVEPEVEVEVEAGAEGETLADEDTGEVEVETAAWQPAMDLAMLAGQMGVAPETVTSFGSDGALRAALQMLEQRGATEQAAADTAAVPLPEFAAYEIPEFDPEQDGGEQYQKALAGMNEHWAARDKSVSEAVQSQLGELQGLIEQQGNAMYEGRYNTLVDALPGEWTETLGKGEAVNETQFAHRKKLFGAWDRAVQMEAQSGRTTSMAKLLQEALPGVFQKQAEGNMRKKVTGQVKGRKKIQKPAAKQAPPLTDDAAAIAFWEEQEAKNGQAQPVEAPDPMATFYGRDK